MNETEAPADELAMPWPLANIIHRPDVAEWLAAHDARVAAEAWNEAMMDQ